MKMPRAMHRCAAWIACLAILLAALAPSISHALATHASTNISTTAWVEICTEQGSKMILVDSDHQSAPSSDPEHLVHIEHCPFCQPHSVATALPPSADIVIAAITSSRIHPFLFYQAPHGHFTWNAAASRAPPIFS